MDYLKKLMNRQELGKIVRFGVTGVLNTLVDYLVFMVLNTFLGIGAGISQTASYIAGMLNSYLVNKTWTFRSKERLLSQLLIRFIIANLAVLGVSILLIELLAERWGIYPLLAKLPVTVVTMVLNFVISRLWIFR